MKEAWFSPVHTYPLLATRYLCFFIMAAFRSRGNSWVSQEWVQWYIAVVTLEMWLEKQVLLQWADYAELNSSLLHFKFWLRLSTRNSLGFWMWPLGLDTEAGVLKKLRAQSPEIPISVCRPVSLAERLWLSAAAPGWKKVILLLRVERSGMAVLHHQCGPFGGFHMWWRHFQHSFCSCSSKLIPGGFFSLKW